MYYPLAKPPKAIPDSKLCAPSILLRSTSCRNTTCFTNTKILPVTLSMFRDCRNAKKFYIQNNFFNKSCLTCESKLLTTAIVHDLGMWCCQEAKGKTKRIFPIFLGVGRAPTRERRMPRLNSCVFYLLNTSFYQSAKGNFRFLVFILRHRKCVM